MGRILLLDKGASPVHPFKKPLARKGFSLVTAGTLKDAVAFIRDGIDLITVDPSFLPPKGLSRRFCRLVADIPVIFLAGPQGSRQNNTGLNGVYTAHVPSPLSFRDYLRCLKMLLKDKTRDEEIKTLRAQLMNRRKELAFYADIIKMSSSVTDARKGLNATLDTIRQMTGARACSLLFNDEPVFQVMPLAVSRKISKFTFSRSVGISGWVLEKGIPLTVHDVSQDRRFNAQADSFSNLKIRSLLCAPLKIKDRVVGILRAANKKDGTPFTDEDMNLLITAANYTSIALERTFLYEKLKNDELTNLFNVRHLDHALEMEIERALRYQSTFSLIFMDIDNFKSVNDKYGHLVGSRALIEVAHILQQNLRKVDVISRYGGDEFVIILPQTARDACLLVAERLRKVIEKNLFLRQQGFSIRITASFGIATFPSDAATKEELLRMADTAMYRGKFSTKNIVFSAR